MKFKIWLIINLSVLLLLVNNTWALERANYSLNSSTRKKIDPELYELINAEDRTLAADKYGLQVSNSQVKVLLVLRNLNYSLPAEMGRGLNKYRDLYTAMVYIDKLTLLAKESDISSIEKPVNAVILGGDNEAFITFQRKFILYGIGSGIICFTLFLIFYLILKRKKTLKYSE